MKLKSILTFDLSYIDRHCPSVARQELVDSEIHSEVHSELIDILSLYGGKKIKITIGEESQK